MTNEKQKGIFISIDGSDGSGKSTQKELIIKRLESSGFKVKSISFPQYSKKSAGLVEEYLNGKYGGVDDVGPYPTSIFYAVDRFDAKKRIEDWLNEGFIVISDRYVSANMGHQGSKIKDKKDREEFYNWLDNLEYEILKVPKPNLNIILHVNYEISKNNLDKLEKKEYLEEKSKDIHEENIEHLKKASETYLEISKNFSNFTLIDCSPDNYFLDKETINDLIWDKIYSLIKPKEYSPNFKELLEKERNVLFNNILKVEKVTPTAKMPTRAYSSDAGLDIYSAEARTIYPGEQAIIRTGVKMAIPDGYVGLVWDKSGIAKAGLNTMGGVIDAGFRGEVSINVSNVSNNIYNIEVGQKIAQMLIQKIELPVVLETKIDDRTERGEDDYGSTGLF